MSPLVLKNRNRAAVTVCKFNHREAVRIEHQIQRY